MTIRVQSEDFDVSAEIAALRLGNPKVGAVAAFVGTVRDLNEGSGVATMTLEHSTFSMSPSCTELANSNRKTKSCWWSSPQHIVASRSKPASL
jgi:molybdopterin synthase catalytic subunit